VAPIGAQPKGRSGERRFILSDELEAQCVFVRTRPDLLDALDDTMFD
jgi:hypothetical protein